MMKPGGAFEVRHPFPGFGSVLSEGLLDVGGRSVFPWKTTGQR